MRTAFIALSLIVALAIVPGTALAQDNSAIDEYTENVPSGGGDKPSDEVGSGSDGNGSGSDGNGGGNALPGSSSEALESQGGDGAAAAALAQATAPESSGAGTEQGSSGDGAGAEQGSSGDGASESGSSGDSDGVLASVGDIVGGSDDDGLGIALPIALIATLIAAIAFVVARRRRGPGEAGPA